MVTGIGTDLVEIARVQKAIGRSAFLEKVYTEKERELIAKRPARAAGNFAAKEAVAKALGCGFAGIAPREIEVLRAPSGQPYVVLYGRAEEKAKQQGVCRIRISITDTAEYAQSHAVCEGEEQSLSAEGTDCRKKIPFCLRTEPENAGDLCGGFLREAPLYGSVETMQTGLPLLEAANMKMTDRITIEEKGIPSLVLMERAAMAVTERVKRYAMPESRVGVLCGTGNNGGGGVAVARMLTEAGIFATILTRQPEKCRSVSQKEAVGEQPDGTPEFVQQLNMAVAFAVPICGLESTQEYDIIIDALFGIGLSKDVAGEYAEVIERINAEEHIVIAVDLPSGISADTGAVCGVALRARETVTFGAAKPGQLLYPGREYVGKLTVAEIGFPKALLWEQRSGIYFNGKSVEGILPKRPPYSNKGTFGKVVVIAGSRNMAGAAYFSACAAYRMGVGLVKIVTPECNREILQTLLPEAMLAVYREGENLEALAEQLTEFADALVIGPGLGREKTAEALADAVRKALCRLKADAPPSVWDADVLNLLAEQMKREGCVAPEERKLFLEDLLPEHAVLTPHPGELSRLTGKPVEMLVKGLAVEARRLAEKSRLVYVLKDAVTVVASGKERFINTTGNNGMATGGSGDALCGVIAALLAAGLEPFYAAAAGVWLHGAAGDLAAGEIGETSVMVRDILRALGEERKVFLEKQ